MFNLPYRLLGALSLLLLFFTACEQDSLTTAETELTSTELTTSIALRSDSTVYGLHRRGMLGRLGCFDLVYPVGITFPDGTTAEVADFDVLTTAVSDWIAANPDVEGAPTFVFPIDLTDEAGELISVPDQDSLRALARTCRGAFSDGHRGRGGREHRGDGGGCNSCYTISYPVTVQFPDGTTAEAADRNALRDLTREWKQANPAATERPTYVFPITVTLEDGTTQTVASAEELTALRDSCRTAEGDD